MPVIVLSPTIEASPSAGCGASAHVNGIPHAARSPTLWTAQLSYDPDRCGRDTHSAHSWQNTGAAMSALEASRRIFLPRLVRSRSGERLAGEDVNAAVGSWSAAKHRRLLSASARTLEAEARSLTPRGLTRLIREARDSPQPLTIGSYLLQRSFRLIEHLEAAGHADGAIRDSAHGAIETALTRARRAQRRERRRRRKIAVRASLATTIAELSSVITRHGPPSLRPEPCPPPG